ncbi:MAG: carbonic anhydrase [Muribaculaceae bacterium]|nr:carbonic anhydrase [Muribaculaceae bacterium]
MIDEILKFNGEFVKSGGYEKFVTSKYPDKKLAVLSCMDTRLTELLPAALGLNNGDAKIIKNAGALIMSPYDSAMRSLLVAVYELGVEEIMIVAHTTCGACHMSFGEFKHHMLDRGITDDTLATIKNSGIDLDQWLEGFHDTTQSVLNTVAIVRNHPLMPRDVVVRGFIIDSVTGALEEVK